MKKVLAIVLVLAMALSLFACTKKDDNNGSGEKLKVALIASSSGLGDHSFNDAAWSGFQKAEKELGVEIKVAEPKEVADYKTTACALAEEGFQMIFATGSDWGDTLAEVSKLYPEVKFVGLNVNVEGDNVAIARTADHEIGFLVGALAAMMSESGTVGYIGGKENPSQVRFKTAYQEGVAYVNANAVVLSTFVGAFNDPTTGKEFALEQINQGADVIFHTAGQSGMGLFDAIKEKDGVFAIGVDSNQDAIVEGKVLTTAEKHLGVIAYDMIQKLQNGTWTAGTNVYNLANDGVGITDMEFTKDIIGAEKIDELNRIKAGIIDGSIQVTDTFNQ